MYQEDIQSWSQSAILSLTKSNHHFFFFFLNNPGHFIPELVSMAIMKLPEKSKLVLFSLFHLQRFAALEKERQNSNEDKTWTFLEYLLLSLAKFGKQMVVV